MRITPAIQFLLALERQFSYGTDSAMKDAVGLGRHALERIVSVRQVNSDLPFNLLPGEDYEPPHTRELMADERTSP